jgi:hypothetical protein
MILRPKVMRREKEAEMARMSKEKHIETIGERRYWTAYDHAMMQCKLDSRLVGLTKIREAISTEAALRATGFDERPFTLPKGCGGDGSGRIEMQAIADGLLVKATAAAREAVAEPSPSA